MTRFMSLASMSLAGLAIAACLHFADGAVAQQAYPSRTVKFIMPYGAASASDITAVSVNRGLLKNCRSA